MSAATATLRFERGTLSLGAFAAEGTPAVWDARTASFRVAACRFAEIAHRADARGVRLDGDVRTSWQIRPRDVAKLDLRPYQTQALASWNALSRRGVIVLPTGAGKTRVALAAIAESGLPTAILCPTKVLAAAWVDELAKHFPDERIGLIGDAHRSVERITVLTFESAYRHMDSIGDRFGLLIVDEVHHFDIGQTWEGRRALRNRAHALELASFPRAKRSLVRSLLARHCDDRSIVFTALAQNSYDVARDNLIPVITGETSVKERREILDWFKAGTVRALASARVLNEGVDVPDARVALLVAGVLGAREYVQRIGRVLRPAPNKRAVVYELITMNTSEAWQSRLKARHAPSSTPHP